MKAEGKQANRGSSRAVDRKLLLLIGLIASIALALYTQWNASRKINHTLIASQQASKRMPGATGVDRAFAFSQLKDPQPPFVNEKRNLFTFYEPPPPPPRPESAEAQATVSQEPEVICGDQICQVGETYEDCPSDCQPPPPPEIALRYIGYLAEKDGRVAFLTDGKEVFMGRENDIIANKYRILKITDQNVELGYLNLNQSRSIPFQGNNQS